MVMVKNQNTDDINQSTAGRKVLLLENGRTLIYRHLGLKEFGQANRGAQ